MAIHAPMEKSPLTNEINLLSRCLNFLEEKFGVKSDEETELLTEKIGAQITGKLTLPKWKAACLSVQAMPVLS